MRKLICLLSIFILVSAAGCAPRQPSYVSRNAFLLDTIVTIRIDDPGVEESVFDDAFAEIERLDALLSVHTGGSDIDRLRQSAGVEPVSISPETLEVLQKSLTYSRLSDSLFDITTGPLIDLWAIRPPEGHVPTERELSATLPLIGWRHLQIDEEASTAYLPHPGMSVDLGAIAKGYIADKVKELLLSRGVSRAIINLGGNTQLIGDTPYRIGIQDPDGETGACLGMVSLSDVSASTSGDYERYFEEDGVRYHHILNPKTGYPARTGLRSATVICPYSVDADSLSTTVFLMGPEAGMALIEELPDTEAVLVTADREILLSSGIADQFELIESLGYTLAP